MRGRGHRHAMTPGVPGLLSSKNILFLSVDNSFPALASRREKFDNWLIFQSFLFCRLRHG